MSYPPPPLSPPARTNLALCCCVYGAQPARAGTGCFAYRLKSVISLSHSFTSSISQRLVVKYEECRSSVFAPDDRDPETYDRSAPESSLELDFVYGYHNTGMFQNSSHDNIYVLANGEFLWYSAATCIMYDRILQTQRFFQEHDDDVRI